MVNDGTKGEESGRVRAMGGGVERNGPRRVGPR